MLQWEIDLEQTFSKRKSITLFPVQCLVIIHENIQNFLVFMAGGAFFLRKIMQNTIKFENFKYFSKSKVIESDKKHLQWYFEEFREKLKLVARLWVCINATVGNRLRTNFFKKEKYNFVPSPVFGHNPWKYSEFSCFYGRSSIFHHFCMNFSIRQNGSKFLIFQEKKSITL